MKGVVYGLYAGDTLLYIGSSENPEARRKAHVRRGVAFDRLAILRECPNRYDAWALERMMIREANPPLNTVCTRRGDAIARERQKRNQQQCAFAAFVAAIAISLFNESLDAMLANQACKMIPRQVRK